MGSWKALRLQALTIAATALLLSSLLAPGASAASSGTLNSPPYAWYDQDTNANGLANWLVVNATLVVSSPGILRVEGILFNGSVFVAAASVQVTLNTGSQTVPLQFYGGAIRNSRQVGTFLILASLYNDRGDPVSQVSGLQGFHDWTRYDGSEAYYASYSASPWDTDGDSKYNWVRVATLVQLNVSGHYLLLGQLRGGGTDITDFFEQRALAMGTHPFDLRFSGPTINRRGINGPYNVTIMLINATGILQDLRTLQTAALNASAFESPSVRINAGAGYSNYTADLDRDGKADVLRVNVTVQAFEAASFTLSAELWDGPRSRQVSGGQSDGSMVGAGNATVQVQLSGFPINRSGVNQPYALDLDLEDATYGWVDQASTTIGRWTHNDFDRPPASLGAPHTSYLVDTDADGRANYILVNVTVTVVQSGGFAVQAFLMGNQKFLGVGMNLTHLNPGTYVVPLKLSAPVIQVNQVAGSYNVTLFLSSFTGAQGEDPLEVDRGYHITPAWSLSQLQHAVPAVVVGRITNATNGQPLRDVEVRIANYGDGFLGGATTNATGDFTMAAYAGSFYGSVSAPDGLQAEVHTFSAAGITTHNWVLREAPRDTTAWSVTFPTWSSASMVLNLTKRSENQSIRFDLDAFQNLDGYMQQWELDTFIRIMNFTFIPADTSEAFIVDNVVFDLRAGSSVETFVAAGPVTSTAPLRVTGNGTYDARSAISLSGVHRVNTTLDYPEPGEDNTGLFRFPARYGLLSYTTAGNASVTGRGTNAPTLSPGRDPNPSDSLDKAWVNMTVEEDLWAPTISSTAATPNPREYAGAVNLTAVVTDGLLVASVTVQVTDPTNASVGTFTMAPAASNTFYHNSTAFNKLGTYSYTLRATDGVGNLNTTSSSFVVKDTTPATISAYNSNVTSVEVFGWVNLTATVTDNHQVQTVEVIVVGPQGSAIRPMTKVGSTWYYSARYNATGSYNFSVRATDASANVVISTPKVFSVVDTTPPVAAAGVDRTVERATAVTLVGTASADNYGVANYTWTFTVGGATVTIYGGSPGYTFDLSGTYDITLTVRDSAGNSHSDVVRVTVQDSTAPAQPQTPQVGQGTPESSLLLSWSPAPERDVVGYEVYRSESAQGPWVKVHGGVLTAATYTDTQLQAGKTYHYRIVAVDRDGNRSPLSNTVSHTVPTPLFAPSGMGTLVLLAVAAGGIAGALALRHRRRGPKGPSPMPPSPSPEPFAPPPEGPLANPPTGPGMARPWQQPQAEAPPPAAVVDGAPPATTAPGATSATSAEDELLMLLKKEPRPRKDDDIDLDH